MAKYTPSTISSGYNSNTTIDSNFDNVATELNDKVLYRDNPSGEPNSMQNDLDMNGYAVINHLASSGDLNFSNSGTWIASADYVINNLVYVTTSESATNGGSTYICLVNHTSGADFDTDFTASYWQLFSKRGAAGAGTGDMLSTNNLSDVGNAATSRTNLGVAIGTNVQAWSADLDVYTANPLLTAELQQLQNIDTTTISAAQWGYLGSADQATATTDNVTFNNVTTGDLTATGAFTSLGIDDDATSTQVTVSDALTSVNNRIGIYRSGLAPTLTTQRTDAHGTGANLFYQNLQGKDSIGANQDYGDMTAVCSSHTAGNESASYNFAPYVGGTNPQQLAIGGVNGGVIVGSSTTSPGSNNLLVDGTVTAGTGLTVNSGGATITAGGLTVTAGDVTATGGGSLTGTWTDLGSVTTVDINGGTIDGATIGATTPAAADFTTVDTTDNITVGSGKGIAVNGGSDYLDEFVLKTSFTPTIYGATTAGTPTYVTQAGHYWRTGNTINFYADVEISAIGGMVGNIRIAGLPFNAAATTPNFQATVLIGFYANVSLSSPYHHVTGMVQNSANFVDLQKSSASGSSAVQDTDLTATTRFILGGSYNID